MQVFKSEKWVEWPSLHPAQVLSTPSVRLSLHQSTLCPQAETCTPLVPPAYSWALTDLLTRPNPHCWALTDLLQRLVASVLNLSKNSSKN